MPKKARPKAKAAEVIPEIPAMPEITVTPESEKPEGEKPQSEKKDAKSKKEKKEKKKAKKKDKRKKEAVIIRFDDAHLPQIDAKAEALGLSRAAWVRMVVAQALAKS